MDLKANKFGQKANVSGFLNLVCRHRHKAEIPEENTKALQGICIYNKTQNTNNHPCPEWHLNLLSPSVL
jgi:hypothetical protein